MAKAMLCCCLVLVLSLCSFDVCRAQVQPSPQQTQQQQPAAFAVATYNINFSNKGLEGVVKSIRAAGADLVALQETNRQSAAYLRRALGKDYPSQVYREAPGAGGFGFLSKKPLQDLKFMPPKHGWFGTWLATAVLDGRKVRIVNVHLQPTIPEKGSSVQALLKRLLQTEAIRNRELADIHAAADGKMPTIFLGDFNCPPFMGAISAMLAKGYIDSFASVTPDVIRHVTWQWPTARGKLRTRLHIPQQAYPDSAQQDHRA